MVIEVGKEADSFSVGDRVACAGQNYASHAEMVYVPKHLCVKIPDALDSEDASFVTLGRSRCREFVSRSRGWETALRSLDSVSWGSSRYKC